MKKKKKKKVLRGRSPADFEKNKKRKRRRRIASRGGGSLTPIPVTHHAGKREGEGWWCAATTPANGRPSPACTGTAPSSARASRERGGGLRPPLAGVSHTCTHQERAREASAGPLTTSRRRPTGPPSRLSPKPEAERERGSESRRSWARVQGPRPCATATGTAALAGRRRAE